MLILSLISRSKKAFRLKFRPKNIQDSLNKSFEEFTENKKALIGDNSKNWYEWFVMHYVYREENDKKAADYKQFLKLQIEVKELEKARQAKAKEEADRQLIEHQKCLNEFITIEKLRERQFKSSYAQQLSQQIAEK